MDTIVPQKRCPDCNRDFPATLQYFHAHKDTKDKLRKECKECRSKQRKAYHVANKAKENARSKAWEYAHPDWRKDYQEENKEHIQQYQRHYSRENSERKRQYRLTHIEHFRAHGRQYHRKHREHYQVIETLYRQSTKGREVGKAKDHRRRVRKMALPGELTAEQIRLKLRLQHFRCYYCHDRFEKRKGKYAFHLDHTIPVSRTEAGPRHDMSYTVLACKPCNLKKHNKLPSEWSEGGRLF